MTIEQAVPNTCALRLTAAQRGIYYAQQIDPDVPMSVSAFVEFHGEVDANLLDHAVRDTGIETEAALLRLVHQSDDDVEPMVVVDQERQIRLGRKDFSGYDDPRAAALTWIDDHRSRTIDLFTDPLLVTYLLNLGDGHSIWYCWGHHFAFDGYAAMYMMVRVAQRYTAFAADEPVPAADIAGMEQIATIDSDYRASTRFDDDREHWTSQFADDPLVTSFSTHSDVAAPVATICSAPLPDHVVDSVRSMAEGLSVRPASVITAAVALYLARYNNADEAMLSLPVAVRDTQILRTSAGLTSNVIPIRSRIDHDHPQQLGDLVREVNGEIKEALRHQRFRHEDITRDVLGAANGRRGFFGPMVNVMLFFEHIDFGDLHGALNILSTGPVEDASVNVYDCMVGGMRLDLEANPNVYDRADVETHHRRLIDFLTRFVVSETTSSATDLSMLSGDEAIRITENCAGESIELGATTLTDLLRSAAVRFTDRPAVVDPQGNTLTYHQFDARTTEVADALSARGIGPESVVGVLLDRGIDQVTALHAIIRAGAIFVPLDPAEPDERRKHILSTAQPSLVITSGDDHHIDFPTTTIGDLRTETAAGPAAPHPDNGAYLLFTSGSTGAPKGVLISHRAIVNRLLWMQHTYPLTPSDRVLQKTPATFDVSVWEYFWPLITGAALVIARPGGHRDPWYLRALIADQRITTTHFVPSMLSAFADVLGDDPDTPAALEPLRRIFTSGEALTPRTVAATTEITHSPVHNLYGPTEAAIDVTFHNDCAATDSTIPIGRPVWNTQTQVLDRRLSPIPDGAVGDLYLGGIQLARGYQNWPGRTAERFVADPFGSGERLYRTGDLVRRRPDGTLEYLGRSDDQVKIRGQRVELGEIEAALSTLAGVRASGVVIRDDLLADDVMVGYVTGSGLEGRDLRTELAALVPDHMIPTVVMVCESLPTTSSGKLNRRALPTPNLTSSEYRSPTTQLEALVHDTVAAVLGVPTVSMTSNLFDLGGNSLSATRVAARLSAATGAQLGLRAIFDAGDVSGIAEALRALDISEHVDHTPAPVHVQIDGPVPLSPAQHRIWLATKLDPAAAATYNMPFTVRLIGALDVDALRAALRDVVARHEPLRTTVVDDAGRPYQRVSAVDDIQFDVELITSAPADPASVRDYAALAFDLSTDLPIRARLIQHGEQDHTLAVVIHHLAADGWSLAPFASDFADAYRARRAGQEPGPATLPVTYQQVSADRAAWLDDPHSSAAGQVGFWANTLADAPVDSDLPYDRAPSGRTDRRGATVRAQIDRATRKRLAELATEQGVTMFMVLHAAVATLLRGMAGSDDIVIGTPVSGRGDGDLDELVGMFVNTLVLRTPVDKHSSFADLLAVVRTNDLAAFDHADVPFDRLVTELNPPRSSSGQPYFDVSVAIEDTPRVELEFAGLTATAARVDTQTSKFDLEFTFTDREGAGELAVEITYAAELFNRETMTGMASRLTRLLRRVAADPQTSVGDTCVLDPSERFDLVPATGTGPRPAEHLSRLLAGAVTTEPDQVAVADTVNGQALTYRELDAASNRLARILIEAGAGPEDFVALSLPRGIDWVVAVWAVVRSGAAWVPIDPDYPPARTSFMLADSGARLLVTAGLNKTGQPPAAVDGVTIIDLDDPATRTDWDTRPGDRISDDDRHSPVEVDQPAYLIYTSGTTGVPKGVIVSHRGLADFAAEQVSRLGLTPQSRTLHLASPSFDASVLEALMAVSAAASMHIVPPGIVGGRELSELMATARVTHAFLTPSLLHTMSPDDLPDLDTLVIGGEHPNAESVRRWSGDKHLFNAYGPTEATVVATMSQDISPADSVTIGRPIRGVAALVLDERLRPVAPGTTGELYLCGTHLARGYHGVHPLTSKRFVANPYAEPGERMYRTGDLVRWRSDHTLEFRGRADHQTKVRGHRIELGEIDAALVAADKVNEAVTVVAGEGDSARLVAYVAGAQLNSDDAHMLRDQLAHQLPKHMVPSAVVALDKIPTTPIGKVDLRALPTPQAPTADHEPLRTDSERAVAATVARLLGLDVATIGREHDFFELGGNSLLATQLAAELEQRAATRIAVRALFDDPRICAIATLATLTPTESDGPAPVPLIHDPDAEVKPGPAQQQLWFLNQFDGSETDDVAAGAYNIAFALELRGDLDTRALAGALTHVVARHEPLRTTYPAHDGQPTLRVQPTEQVRVSLAPQTVDESTWIARSREFASAAFDLTVDTPLRAVLHRISDSTCADVVHRLTVVIHHIAADGASLAPLAHDIAGAYADLHAQRTPEQAALPISYRDYLRWQARSLGYDDTPHPEGAEAPRRIDELTQWWRDELAGIDSGPILTSDAGAMGSADSTAGVVEVEFDDALRTALHAQTGSDTTEFMTVHAILATLLHRMHADPQTHIGSGTSDLTIGTPVAGRADSRLAGLVGMFVNSVPLRTAVRSDMTFSDLLAQVRRTDLDALSHSDMPFEQLVAAVKPPRTGRHPLFQIALTFDDVPLAATEAAIPAFDGLAVSAMEVETGGVRFDLEIRIRNGIARFTYDTAVFSHDRVVDLAHRFSALAHRVADDPTCAVGDYSLALPTDAAAESTAGSPAVTPRHLAELIEHAVNDRPSACALDDGISTLTYRAADESANRWANTLISFGIGFDDVVAVALDRSIESVIAVWAVAKAGATVLPIDPRYPAQRVEHMISDSGALLGITSDSHFDAVPHEIWWLTTDDLCAGHSEPPRIGRHTDGRAYIIYTSGTTGTPKGVSVTHRGLAAFAASQTVRYGVGPDSRTLHFASPSFDAAMLELLLAVDSGATMVIAPPTIYGGDELVDFLAAQEISHAFVTPAALAPAQPRELPHLRCLAVGGESFGSDLVDRWRTGDRRFLNCYGPTETTIVATMSELSPGEPVTIGTPVADSTALILDSRLRVLPPHTPGDLYLIGAGLANGYHGKPGLTAGRFVAAPLGVTSIGGARMYRTGDVASMDTAGVLTYRGRSDRQVKVRGFRIELDEVDSALAAHPSVGTAVTVIDGIGDSARLASYVTAGEDEPPTQHTLVDYLTQRLPRQMIPSTITVLDKIPTTVNGKVDRAALPAPGPASASSMPVRDARTAAERLVVGILSDTLQRPIGIDDDFFDAGGTSLQATTVVSRINAVHRGTPLRVRDVFDNPVVGVLAGLLDVDETGADEQLPDAPAPDSRPRPQRIPLAPMQKRLWSLYRSAPDSVDYAIPLRLNLTGDLDLAALRGALVDIVARHAVLRTIYPETHDGPIGVVGDDADSVIGSLCPTTDDPDTVIKALTQQPFDLSVDAPIRAAVTSMGTTHSLILVIHHIAADGASLPILVADLIDAYTERSAGRTARWEPAAVDYRDYAVAAALDEDGEQDDLRYWTDQLTGAPAQSSPIADRTVADRTGGGNVTIAVDTELRDAIVEAARRNSTSVFTVLHCATTILLNRLGVGNDIVVGTPVANRSVPGGDFRDVVGMFVNTVALRTSIDPADTAQTLLGTIRDADLDAWDHLDAPFDDVIGAINPPRLPGRHPLFQVALSVHDYADSISGEQLQIADGLVGEVAEIDSPTAKFDLQFTATGMSADAPHPALSLTYARNRYLPDTAEQFGIRLLRVVRALTTDPHRAVGDIRVTDPLEVAALCPVSGPPAVAPRTFADLLDEAVRRNPLGVAAIGEHPASGTTSLTYRQLDDRSNRLARLLLARGVATGPESVVAMAIPRSIDALVAIWAIIRTGCAYLPVDPTYPAERIAHMISDSGVGTMVTTSDHASDVPAGITSLVLDDPAVTHELSEQPSAPVSDLERGRPILDDQLAYVIYTSGSTGTPKGVLVPNRGLAAVHDALAETMRPTADSRVLHFASPSFDASVLEFLLAAAGTSTLVIAPTTIYGGDDLASFLNRHHVSHAFITPAAVASMSPADVPELTTLAVGGEAVSPELVRRWAVGRDIRNVYGPTETTIITTESESLAPDTEVTIGGPHRGVGAVVLDGRLHPVPAGVVGDLYLLGDQLTRGYHGRAQLTATRYVCAPMVLGERYAGQRMYCTGDRVRWTADGTLGYAGRADNQVQVRGFRVELSEIDNTLSSQPLVRSAVTVTDTTSGSTVLHSYVTADQDEVEIDTAALRRAVARVLPRHMVPATITELTALPMNAVGKLDRTALPAPRVATSRPAASATEAAVADVFADVLGVTSVGAEDNFFDIGGDSLLATTVVTRLKALGRDVSVPDVFAAPTAAELAAALDEPAAAGSSALGPLLTLRAGTEPVSQDNPPLIVVHPAIGLAWSFTSLLPHVDPARTVYGLQNPALSGAAPARDIGELAKDYVDRIRTAVPHGPYHLLGWSLGGLIAQEMAVRLQRDGETVDKLILLDSYVLADHPDLHQAESIRELLGELGFDTSEMNGEPDLATVADVVRAGGGPLADLSAADLASIHSAFSAAGPLAASWQPRTFVGDAIFVSASADSSHGSAARLDWIDRITGHIRDVAADCSHARMLLPENVVQFAHIVATAAPQADRPAYIAHHRKEQ
ncbi:putative non-ribosomal peptide synthetase [Gordonia effusa NBRC 100432]|uniref:Putative non-ribosomal peptide synthetase n=1 Tax=Gordonia effusa NBRC 100432 TaxID=1077974 RepID=H0R473_9ACTN|nr:non-ribosomal peptide synthetase [Gordonia effusa]GAB19874.1 putative non-ribosomal peptide synthetase [Gordonia effusa NBRC 100432]